MEDFYCIYPIWEVCIRIYVFKKHHVEEVQRNEEFIYIVSD